MLNPQHQLSQCVTPKRLTLIASKHLLSRFTTWTRTSSHHVALLQHQPSKYILLLKMPSTTYSKWPFYFRLEPHNSPLLLRISSPKFYFIALFPLSNTGSRRVDCWTEWDATPIRIGSSPTLVLSWKSF